MINDPINKYFAEKGIHVSYSTLNATETLVRSYIKDFESIVKTIPRQESQYVKSFCYNKLYDIPARKKLTGFENFKKLDNEIRHKINSLVLTPQFSEYLVIDNKENDENLGPYKHNLANHVKTLDNCLLYLSGGIDSELVALSMIENNVKFTPVIFHFTDNSNRTLNLEELSYAYSLCNKYSLLPIIKSINLEELWTSREFEIKAIDMQILSPQLVTHGVMIEIMNLEFSGRSHVFGGEVRFRTNFWLDNGELANLVQLAKTTPGYNGGTYTAGYTNYGGGIGGGAFASTNSELLYSNNGNWQINISGSGPGGDFNTVTASGSWTTTPGSSYEYRIVGLTVYEAAASNYYSPNSSPTSWTSIGGSTSICSSFAATFDSVMTTDAAWSIEVRTSAGAQTNIIQSSNVRLKAST